MTATLSDLTQALDSWGWTYEVDETQSYLVTGVIGKNIEQFTIVFQLLHDGELVRIYTPKLLNIKDHVFKGVVFQAMLNLMWEYSLIRFEYDSTDGEICASIDLFIKDTAVSQKQLDSALRVLIDAVDEYAMPRIKKILATGIDPGRKQLAERMLQQMPEDMLELLAEALQERTQKRQGQDCNSATNE